MKKFLSFLIVFVLAVSMMVPFAINIGAAATSGTTGDCTWALDDNGVLTISGNGAMADYTYDESRPWGTSITEVIIEEGVTAIGRCSFYICRNLTSVTIPSSLTASRSMAFSEIRNQTSVYITDMTAWCNIDFEYGGNPLSAGENSSLYLNNNLVTKLGIPKGVTVIKDRTFNGCDSITSVPIPDGITAIGDYAFSGCNNLSLVTMPESVTTIGEYAFGHTALTSVTIPDSVVTIGEYAFSGCGNLTTVTVPDSVTDIGEYAFFNCDSLDSVYITDMAAWCNIDFASSQANPLYFGGSLYLNNILVTELIIPESVTTIREHAFRNCTSITSVTIPDSVTTIGIFAFYMCNNMSSATIGNSVTIIGQSAFNKTDLTSVTIPDSVTTIGLGAFGSCDNLTSVTVPYTVTSIGSNAFQKSSSSYTPATLNIHEDSAGHTYALENSNPYELIAHTYDEIVTVPSTCTVAGSKSGTCSVCGKDYVEALPLAEHTFDDEPVIVPSTCAIKGSETKRCNVCTQEFITVLPQLEHQIEDGFCTLCGCPDLQSEHPYADNLDQIWTHTVEGAGIISVTFSEETYVEENIDYIYLYNGEDRELGYYTGAQLAGQTVTVRGDTIKIRLVSDSSTNGFGFQVTSITSSPAIEQTTDGVIQLLKHIDGHDVGLDDSVADVNGDGKVTIFDAVRMLQNIAAQ